MLQSPRYTDKVSGYRYIKTISKKPLTYNSDDATQQRLSLDSPCRVNIRAFSTLHSVVIQALYNCSPTRVIFHQMNPTDLRHRLNCDRRLSIKHLTCYELFQFKAICSFKGLFIFAGMLFW